MTRTRKPRASAERPLELRLLADMLRIRRMEEKCAELYGAQKIRGFLHLYIGEEACATGAMHALAADDNVVATYREHGHALLRGVGMGAIMAEMFGKAVGCSRGRGGSMHLFDVARRFYGGNAIVGGGLALGVGLGLADKMMGREQITCIFFGDGAVAEGAFHESLNLAGLWQVPVLFICENNGYAMGTALHYSLANVDIAAKTASYNIPSVVVDGMDVLAVEAAAQEAAAAVRAGDGPHFIECQTYRFRAHSMFDAELYRDRAEVQKWKNQDPIDLLRQRLEAQGLISAADVQQIEADVAAEVNEAVAFAEAGTWEPLEDLTRFVYSERRMA